MSAPNQKKEAFWITITNNCKSRFQNLQLTKEVIKYDGQKLNPDEEF